MSYTMSEYASVLKQRIKSWEDSKAMFLCAGDALASQTNRIFTKGLGVGGKLGTYSKRYANLKKKKGREYKFVNFFFEGRLFADYSTSLTKQGNVWVVGTKNIENSNKAGWLQERYGSDAFHLTDTEKKEFILCVKSSLLKKLQGK